MRRIKTPKGFVSYCLKLFERVYNDAKPSSAFCRRSGMSRFIKNTNDAPSIVPNRGMRRPIKRVVVISTSVFVMQFCVQNYNFFLRYARVWSKMSPKWFFFAKREIKMKKDAGYYLCKWTKQKPPRGWTWRLIEKILFLN